MKTNDKDYHSVEKRAADRRETVDRRCTIRFSDMLGRRTGIERRLPTNKQG